MPNRPLGSHLIAGALLTGAGGITIGLAAIADTELFATVIGAIMIATGVVVMCSVWIPGTSLATAIWNMIAAPFRAYARLYRSQWRDNDSIDPRTKRVDNSRS